MPKCQHRLAATPRAGGVRGLIRVLLLLGVSALLAGPLDFLKLTDPGITEAIVGVLMVVVALPLLEAWGKFLREREINAPFVFLLGALLLSGCAMTTEKVDWVLGDVSTQQMTGPEITTVVTDTEATTTCTGGGCETRTIRSYGFTERAVEMLKGVLGTIVDRILRGP